MHLEKNQGHSSPQSGGQGDPAAGDVWDAQHDVLVFGTGCGGMAAALFAAKKSLDVLLCEKSSQVGGTTTSSGGVLWIPGSAEAQAAGVQDSPERVKEYLRHKIRNHYSADLVDAYVESAPRAAAEIQQGTEVRLKLMPGMSDYQASLPGGMASGRSLEPERFDGRRLGDDFELVRPPIAQLLLLGGLYIDKRRVDEFLNPFASPARFASVVGTLVRYGMDRLRYSRGTDIGAGNALVASMLLSLRQRQVPVWVDSPLVSLVGDAHAGIRGAVIRRDGRLLRVRARHGVVLATGGFPRNSALCQELAPDFPHDQSIAYEGNEGDSLIEARRLGAAVDTELAEPCFWTPTSKVKRPDGSMQTTLYGYLDRGRPGMIAVDASGRRFVNESNSYHDIVVAIFERGVEQNGPFHFVCDRRFVWRRGLGMIRPFRPSLARYVKNGYIVQGSTLRELAGRIGVDPDALEQTVARHNGFCKTGVDLDFGKGSDPYNRQFGDPRVAKPNPNLAPIEHGPFFALRIFPASLGTTVGLKTTADAQVVAATGSPIPGLYACGNDMGNVFRGYYPGGGATLGPGLVFAYRAVDHIAAQTTVPPARSNKAPPSPVS